MNEHVFTITTSACAASFTISTPSFNSEPTMISASTRFLAQPREIMPTRTGRSVDFGFKGRTLYATAGDEATSAEVNRTESFNRKERKGRKEIPILDQSARANSSVALRSLQAASVFLASFRIHRRLEFGFGIRDFLRCRQFLGRHLLVR